MESAAIQAAKPDQVRAVHEVYLKVLIEDGQLYLTDPRQHPLAGPLLIRLCQELPADTDVPISLGTATAAEYASRFARLDRLVRIWSARVGSWEAHGWAAEVIDDVKAGVDFPVGFGERRYLKAAIATLDLLVALNSSHDYRRADTRIMILQAFGQPDITPGYLTRMRVFSRPEDYSRYYDSIFGYFWNG